MHRLGQPWGSWLEMLASYRREHGDLHIPVKYRSTDGFALGQWLAQKRSDYRLGKLDEDRADELRALGVDFDPRSAERPDTWQDWLVLLSAYRAEFGDTDVPNHYVTPAGEHLGNWLLRQRRAHWSGTLSAQRASALRELGVMLERRTQQEADNRRHRRPTAPPWRPKNWPIPER